MVFELREVFVLAGNSNYLKIWHSDPKNSWGSRSDRRSHILVGSRLFRSRYLDLKKILLNLGFSEKKLLNLHILTLIKTITLIISYSCFQKHPSSMLDINGNTKWILLIFKYWNYKISRIQSWTIMETSSTNLNSQMTDNSLQNIQNDQNEESERLARIGEMSPSSVTGRKVDRKPISFEL